MGLKKIGMTNYTTWDNDQPLTYFNFAPNILGATEQCAIYAYGMDNT